MAISTRYHHHVQSIALAIILLTAATFSSAERKGFSVELIHRDSPKSPYYNPAETPYERLHNALRLSMSRVERITRMMANPDAAVPASDVTAYSGIYLMNISIGTPPYPVLGEVDTGSDLTWIQCKPCDYCYKQYPPFFDPSSSSTYQDIPCHSDACASLQEDGKCRGDICQYDLTYATGFFSRGNLARDTVTLDSTSGQPMAFNSTIFGCTHNSGGGAMVPEMSGIVGLGGDAKSLVSQMGDVAGGIFSYCLIPYFTGLRGSSRLNFGSSAVVSGAGTVSTSLVYDKWYFLTLAGISVSGKRIEVENPLGSSSSSGNIIIDSGAAFTYLPEKFYIDLESSVSALMKLPRVPNPPLNLRLCYNTTETEFDAPSLTVHFDGVDIRLSNANIFIRMAPDTICFAFRPNFDGHSIYGSLAQTNFLIGYDILSNILSFKPIDCTQI